MSMDCRAVLSFGIVFDADYEEDLTERFNIPEDYDEDWVEYICESGVVEAHRCGYDEADTVILCIPNTYVSITWQEVLDVEEFMGREMCCSLADIDKFNKWLKKHDLDPAEASWQMSTYYG